MTIKYQEFIITHDKKPIPDRRFDYDYWHEDYDGAEDGGDNRCGNGESVEDCKRQINEYWEHSCSALNEENYLETC